MLVQVGKGIVELMPRFLNYNNNREPVFARYLVINKRVKSTDFIKYSPEQYFWIDPDSPEYDGLNFGLLFHSFVGEDSESIHIS
jgi:CRISPR-associated protein Cas5t